ncbi:MAG: hypothetical protein HYR56_00975 [Acidobacteria bacterium]|nr:hypothetical protein [Acidobacteriota bacterium]MBI3424853.1 hypothetical protein [Acidobacteriota bacterium]
MLKVLDMSATTLDEVIAQLTAILDHARQAQSRLGYFAALYLLVTLNVKAGIQAGRFEDGVRMEQFVVTFANRYLAALEAYQQQQPCSECWRVAFAQATAWRPLILQHLLLGMNAHINYDLGIAAATVAPGAKLVTLEHDFNEINKILAGLVKHVQTEIGALSPWLWLLDKVSGRADEVLINFSMQRARDAAWKQAQRLAPLPQAEWAAELQRLDRTVTALGRLIRHPGWVMSLRLLVIRLRESSDVGKVIEALRRAPSV